MSGENKIHGFLSVSNFPNLSYPGSNKNHSYLIKKLLYYQRIYSTKRALID